METIHKAHFDRLYVLELVSLVMREGSFAAAAKRLNTSPSNITKDIQKLENYLGIKIFNRTTRSLSLTPSGNTLVKGFNDINYDIHDLISKIKNEKEITKGSLKITAPTSLGENILAPFISEFQIMHPYLDIDLIFTDNIIDPLEYGVDISIRTSYQLNDSSYYAKKIGRLKRIVCASPSYLKKFGTPKKLKDLNNHNCLLYMRGQSPFKWILKNSRKKELVQIKGTFKSNNLRSLLNACLSGVGISILPLYLINDYLKNEELIPVFKTWAPDTPNIYILTLERPSESRKLETFIEFIEEKLNSSSLF